MSLVILSGTNRPGSVTRKVAGAADLILRESGVETTLLDLQKLPQEIFRPTGYETKPDGFVPFQQAIYDAKGLLIVTPEYNGSFPGVLKYFIDMLSFPKSLVGVPVAFIGVAAGHFGAVRSVEQLGAIVQYRSAHLFGKRLFLHGVGSLTIEGKSLGDPDHQRRFEDLLRDFAAFCRALDKA